MKTFFLLMSFSPEAQSKAQAEIDQVVGEDRLVMLADRPGLPYVSALIQEVMRWNVVGPLGTRICILPPFLAIHDVFRTASTHRG